MGFWIRAQNKESLGYTAKIGYSEFASFHKKGHFIVGADESSQAFLGEYATKERALQVLDEIQTHITDMQAEQNYNLSLAGTRAYDNFKPVFEMPAE